MARRTFAMPLIITMVSALLLVAGTPGSVKGSVLAAGTHSSPLKHPCSDQMRQRAPPVFTATFSTNYGTFTATCDRMRAPFWVDRVYNLARLGYYSDNYYFRVLNTSTLKIVQFGTNGDPSISNVYNYSETRSECAIIEPQPPLMPRCMARNDISARCPLKSVGLSNTYGTLVMSTSGTTTLEFPQGVTWNATAELFINTGNNSWLDPQLFVPICTLDDDSMQSVLRFPSFGEVADLGGPGPSLGLLYQDGNPYIEANPSWATMAKTSSVHVQSVSTDTISPSSHSDLMS